MKAAAILAAMIALASPAFAQSFSCRIGKEPACLDYGDTVCSSQGKCVDRNAACFAPYQCDFNGFACKSDVQDCAKAHDTLLDEYRALETDYDKNLKAIKALADAYDDLERTYHDTHACITSAVTLADAQLCLN